MNSDSPNAILPRLRASAALLAGLALAATAAPLQAQEGQPQAPAQVQQGQAASELGNWIKICAPDQQNENEEVCLITQEVRTENGEFLSSISIREPADGEGDKMLMVAVPPGVLLQPGFRVQVDEKEQKPGEYVICLPNACYGEMQIEPAFINDMKAGSNLVVSVINNQGQPVGVGLTLVGFTSGYDGDPVDTEVLAQERQRLQEELQKRAEDARRRLQEEQPSEGQEGEAPAAGEGEAN